MAKRKRKRKKSVGTLSRKIKHTPARKRARKRGFMSEVMTASNAMEAGKATGAGAIGGGITYAIDALGASKINNQLARGAVHLGASFLIGAVLGGRQMGAGMAGAWSYSTIEAMRQKGMQENFDKTKYTDAEILNRYPDGMDENGTPMYLAEDENGNEEYVYLEQLQDYDLSANSQARLYPGYVNTSQF